MMGMAGPGGGPPRKSHTKSRKGCRKCKTRHIRCDEHFPQCRNCTKHSVRCDYMDVTRPGDEPAKGSQTPELLTSPEIQQILDNWRLTGQPPFLELRKPESSYWTGFSTIDLRLVHHVTTLSSDLYRRGYSQCIVWTPKMSNLISIALFDNSTMNALLAFSASHLAWQTKNTETSNLASEHGTTALRGLREALGSFSQHTSEAVLATSMLLSWQARDWQTWVSLQQDVSTLLGALRQWAHQPELANFWNSQTVLARATLPGTPSSMGLPSPNASTVDVQQLDYCLTALYSLRLRLSSYPELVEHVDGVIEYVEQVQRDLPVQDAGNAFERLLHLRSIIFWTPSYMLQPDDSDLGPLATSAHLYALALVLEPLFPECLGLYLGNMSLEPLEKICQTIRTRAIADPQNGTIQTALSMLDVPLQIAQSYRQSHRVVASPAMSYQYSPSQSVTNVAPTSDTYDFSPSPDLVRHSSYPHVALKSQGIQQFQAPYNSNGFQIPMNDRQLLVPRRALSDTRTGTGPSAHSLPSSILTIPQPMTQNIDYFMDATGYSSMPSYSSAGDFQNRLVPPQIWI